LLKTSPYRNKLSENVEKKLANETIKTKKEVEKKR
jgi:hypothetical protein